MLFWKKEQKVVIALSPREVRLMMTALLNFRNKAVKAGKPTEDINALLMKVIDAPEKKPKRKFDRER